MPNKLLCPEKYFKLFCSTCLAMKTNYYYSVDTCIKRNFKNGVQGVVSSNKIKFESYGDSIGEAYSHYNDNTLDNEDPFC